MNWIKASDRLPEEEGNYIVTCLWHDNEVEIDILWFEKTGDEYYNLSPNSFNQRLEDGDGFDFYISRENVIAWMPLPEPYNPNRD